MGLYVAEPKKTAAELLPLAGAKRLSIVMLRDVSSTDLATSFTTAFNANSTREERARMFGSIAQFNSFFESASVVKRGDTITLDWVPGSGMSISRNDESVGNTIGDAAFYQAALKVWLGTRPIDSALKTELMRGPATPVAPDAIQRKGREITDR
jgi:hypothetical protein